MLADPSSSAGLGGMYPQGSTDNPLNRVDWIAWEAWHLETIRSESPGVLWIRKCWCRAGRRRSASTTSTFAPLRARATARLAVVVVLPSPGFALVRTSARPPSEGDEKIRFVRRTRYASATAA